MAFQTQFLKKALREANSKALHGFSRPTFCASFSSIPSSYAAMGADESKPVLPPFDYEPRPYKGPLTDEIFQKRKKFLGPSLFHYYQKPVISQISTSYPCLFQFSAFLILLWFFLIKIDCGILSVHFFEQIMILHDFSAFFIRCYCRFVDLSHCFMGYAWLFGFCLNTHH